MKSTVTQEEKIKKSFTTFFSEFTEKTWRPIDFKKHQRAIYNILCREFKNNNNKIHRDFIVKNFVPEDKRNTFNHTNIYNKQWIVDAFKAFFAAQKKQGKTSWTVKELEWWNESLLITLSREYGYQGTQTVDREKFVEDYKLNELGCVFKRNAPLRTPITLERINKDLQKILTHHIPTRSPDDLKPQYLKRLGKKRRDEKGNIDRLYIIHKVLEDKDIVNAFDHRYSYNRLLKVPTKAQKKFEIDNNQGKIDHGTLNPEEILIKKEEQEIKNTLLKRIYHSIETSLSDEEREILFTFLEGNQKDKQSVQHIIIKLKDTLELKGE